MQSVARAAGVSRSTVSKALRDDPTIPVSRRDKIKAIASRLGYRPHPLVAALMAQLHSRRRRTDPHFIAWIDLWTKGNDVARGHDPSLMLRGAQERAQELGYNIEVHRVANDDISPARLRQILITRSQWAVIFPPAPESGMRYPIDMVGLTGVTIGASLHEPVMHRVSHNYYRSGKLACQKLREKAFRRIGLVLSPWADERTESKWRAAYLVEQQQWPVAERLPPLLAAADEKEAFQRWFRRHKPDAIVAVDPYVADWLCLRQGPSVRIVWLSLLSGKKNTWAVDQCSDRLGAAAVELVIGQIHRNERGNPARPHTLLIDGEWLEG